MTASPVTAAVLLVAIVATSLAVVYSRHQDRKLFIELQALGYEKDAMDVEYGQLQLEQSTLTLLMDDPQFTEQIRNVVSNLDSSGQEIRELTNGLNGLVADLQAGEGTLGVLLRDTVMAAEISHGLKYLDSGLVKFDENMEALKHNWLTRGYFKKLEREQRKQEKREHSRTHPRPADAVFRPAILPVVRWHGCESSLKDRRGSGSGH